MWQMRLRRIEPAVLTAAYREKTNPMDERKLILRSPIRRARSWPVRAVSSDAASVAGTAPTQPRFQYLVDRDAYP